MGILILQRKCYYTTCRGLYNDGDSINIFEVGYENAIISAITFVYFSIIDSSDNQLILNAAISVR